MWKITQVPLRAAFSGVPTLPLICVLTAISGNVGFRVSRSQATPGARNRAEDAGPPGSLDDIRAEMGAREKAADNMLSVSHTSGQAYPPSRMKRKLISMVWGHPLHLGSLPRANEPILPPGRACHEQCWATGKDCLVSHSL